MIEIDVTEDEQVTDEVASTQFNNWVRHELTLTKEIETGDDRDASWQWEIGATWIRLDQ